MSHFFLLCLSLYGLIFEFQIDGDERIQHWFMYVYGARWEFFGIWIKHELNNSQRNAWKLFELKGASVKRRRFFLFCLDIFSARQEKLNGKSIEIIIHIHKIPIWLFSHEKKSTSNYPIPIRHRTNLDAKNRLNSTFGSIFDFYGNFEMCTFFQFFCQ